jgi:hypothetical protein
MLIARGERKKREGKGLGYEAERGNGTWTPGLDFRRNK